MTIKIAHVLYSFEVGGLENGVVNLINGLDQQRYSHVILCLTRASRLVDRLRRNDVEILELGKEPGNSWWLPLRLARLLRRLEPDIVHTRNWGTMDAIVAARLGLLPIVVHGEHGRTMEEVNGDNQRRIWGRKLLAGWVDRFVTVSHELRDWLNQKIGVAEGKITTICNGVDLERFCGGTDKQASRNRCGLKKDAFLVGTVGRLDPIKDHAALVKAIAELAPRYPHLQLVIVGAGPCYDELQTLIETLGLKSVVSLLGEQHDVPELLQALDLFVLPSKFEGISNTLLEAMACGLPVVATAAGGNLELVADGNNGLLVPKQNHAALCGALLRYLEDPLLAGKHGCAGRQRAEKHFSLERMISAYDDLYTELVSNQKHRSESQK